MLKDWEDWDDVEDDDVDDDDDHQEIKKKDSTQPKREEVVIDDGEGKDEEVTIDEGDFKVIDKKEDDSKVVDKKPSKVAPLDFKNDEFDWLTEMPECIGEIEDQMDCGACWAFSSSGFMSDRFCI